MCTPMNDGCHYEQAVLSTSCSRRSPTSFRPDLSLQPRSQLSSRPSLTPLPKQPVSRVYTVQTSSLHTPRQWLSRHRSRERYMWKVCTIKIRMNQLHMVQLIQPYSMSEIIWRLYVILLLCTGLTFYTASFAFIRHTLGALYTDLRVDLRSVRVHGPRSSSGM